MVSRGSRRFRSSPMRITEPSPATVAKEIAARIAAWGLPDATSGRPIDVADGMWPGVLAHLAAQRVSGLAVAAAAGCTLQVPGAWRDALRSQHRAAMAWCLSVERTVLRVARWFGDAGVPFVVLKGLALAHTLYPDPTWRAFGDLDLLVHTRDWRRACAVLEQRGYPRELPEPRRGFDERFGKAAVFLTEEGVQVDLHRTLVLGPFGLWMDPAELFDHTATFTLGGREFRRLDDTATLLNVALHAVLGSSPPRLVPLRDLLQVVRHGAVDWALLGDWAVRWRMGAVLGSAFTRASEVLGSPVPPDARPLVGHEPGRRERRALEAYTSERRHRGGPAVTTLRAIPRVRDKAAYVRALVLPDRRFLEARGGQTGARGSYVRRLKVPLRWMTGNRPQAEPHVRSGGRMDGRSR